VVCVLAALMAVPVMARAGSAAADDRPLPDVLCPISTGIVGRCPPPPLLGTLDRGLTTATPDQVKSLRQLEADAIADVIELHGLSESDTSAVLTWGRSEAQAQLFTLLLNALNTDEDDRSDDQQNAVDWMTTMMHRKAEAAAVAAGREYVSWAGLNQLRFGTLLNANASESELRDFLDDSPQNYNDPNTAAATGGYCVYRSPNPYGSEYTGYNDPTCFARCASILGCNPPTPSYDQFVKWGEAAANYSLLNSEQFARSVAKIGMVMGLAVAVGTAAAVGAIVPAAIVGSATAAIFPYAGTVAYTTGVAAAAGLGAAATLATVVGIVIMAVVIAVMQGLIVINAAELPGQLAELIFDAVHEPPRVDELIDTSEGMTTLLSLFVLATMPDPRDEYCDNSSTIPENIKHSGFFVNLSWIPCLNPTGIPDATPYDPRFLIKEDGETTGTVSPTITFRDFAQTTTTARLHDGWFILEPTGSYDEQTLTIEYIDWNGKERQAWLLGNPDDGQVFVSLDATDRLDMQDCLDDGQCSESKSLNYLSPDGKKMSASVEQWKPAVGAPSYDATPVERSPTSFDANGFAPADATGEVSYEWRFERAPCTKPCVLLEGPLMPPDYGDPVSGATVTHTWPYAGDFAITLTATDAEGRTATTRIDVQVENLPPRILEVVPDCRHDMAGNPVPGPGCLPRTGSTATARRLRGTFVDGQFDLQVYINWGDGSRVADCIPAAEVDPFPSFPGCPDSPGNDLELKPVEIGGDRVFEFQASHVYAEPGVYHGTMWVSDGVDGTAEPFTMTIEEPTDVLVSTNTADGVVRLAEPDTTSHTIDVRLASRPSADIIVAVTADNVQTQVVDGFNLTGASYTLLTFTRDNWDQPRSVTVRAIDDSVDEENPHPTGVSVSVIRGEGRLSVDGQFGTSGRILPVEVADDDQAGLVTSPTSLELTEGGPAADVTVGLSSTPKTGAVVNVTATTSGLCTVSPASLTDIQYNAPRTLTVTPGRDHVPGDRDCTVHLATASPQRFSPPPLIFPLPRDLDYEGLTADVAGPVTNVDIPGVTVTPTELALDTTEANPTATYQVVLDTMPADDVTITPTTTDPAVTVSGPVTFTPDNWDQPQTVTLTAPADTAPHTAVINHDVTAGDAAYLALDPGDVNVAVGDPATRMALTANPDQPTTTKPTSVTATLTADVGTPTGGVVFRVDGDSPCDCGTEIVDGVAHIDVGRLPAGPHTITATYSGDATHRPADASIELLVTAVTPEPVDDAVSISEDAGFTTVDVLANDTDGDGLSINENTEATNGVAICELDACSYRPNPDFHGTDSFTYTVTEGTNTATATVTITVDAVNDPPAALADASTTAEDTATTIEVVGNDTDVDGDSLTIEDHTQPANGEVVCDDSSCSYTPDRDFHGVDTFAYTVSDGVDTATAAVTVTVDPVGDPPVAVDDAATTDEDTAATIEVAGNDSDVDDDPLTVEDHTQPTNGDVVCDETSCTYTPNRDFHGTDSFTYMVSDGDKTATATVTITVDAVNDPPAAIADASTTAEDTATTIEVVGNDTDVDGDSLTIEDHTQPADGEVVCDDSSCTYTPRRDFHGVDTFTYTVSDDADTATATVTVTVDPVGDPPVATDDAATTAEDTAAATIDVVGNDTDVDGQSLTIEDHGQPADGEVVCDESSCSYTPNRDFHGTDSFTYTVSDGVDTASARVTVTVDAVNDLPVAADDTYTAVEDNGLEVAAVDGLLANDGDVDGDVLAAAVEDAPAHAAVTVHDDGSFTYVPASGYIGLDSFTYRVRDVTGATSPVARVSVTVAAATVTALTATPNPSRPGQRATFTATVTADGEAMTTGAVTFRDGATTLAAGVAVDDHGQATFTTVVLADGTHRVTAVYEPPEGFAPSSSDPLTQVVDGDGPVANPTTSPVANAAGWHRGPVTATWNWNDRGAGVEPAHCRNRSTADREGRHTLSAACRDRAGNETTATHSLKVDSTSPTVIVDVPTNARYLQGAAVAADYTCRDGLSGVAACTGPVADGAGLDTSSPGRHRFVVTAVDRAGNARTVTVTYHVVARPICAGRPATIVGTAGNDVINGTGGDDVIVSGAGRDWIRARGGNDVICAGGARDVVLAADGDDNVDPGAGRDVVSGGVGDDTITGRAGADILTGGLGADALAGGLGADSLIGHDGDDHLSGGPGADTCRGGAGADQQASCEVTLGVP
jgi:Ca2+-binding RTX toxin-like protein